LTYRIARQPAFAGGSDCCFAGADYRITLTLQITEHEILLPDIGRHDEVYG